MNMLYQKVSSRITNHCKQVFDTPLLNDIIQWVEDVVFPWLEVLPSVCWEQEEGGSEKPDIMRGFATPPPLKLLPGGVLTAFYGASPPPPFEYCRW